MPSASDARHIAQSDFDRISGARLKHYLRVGRSLVRPEFLLKTSAQINAAVVPGKASASRLDAFEFLRHLSADVVYLDPPYGGTQPYEKAFELIDEFLGVAAPPVSPFSSKRPPLDELLDACSHIPVVAFSLNNAVFDDEELRALVTRHRQVVRLASIPHRHYGSIATAAKNEINREFLVLATKEATP